MTDRRADRLSGRRADRRWPRWVYGVGEEPDPRWTLANERTFLAWVRTGLGFVTAGAALATLTQYLAAQAWEVHVAAAVFVVCGVLCGVLSVWRWARNERAMRLGQPLPSSPAMVVVTVALILVAAITVLVLLPW